MAMTIIVCSDPSVAATVPGSRQAATNNSTQNSAKLKLPSGKVRPSQARGRQSSPA